MVGSVVCMPILVINMGGEMMYILNQRLHAQNIPEEKATKVLSDVIRTMFTPVFLEELFKPQEIYSHISTKQIFDKLAHSSIMRLNKTSMDKLYDLMTMGVKYQLLQCNSPLQYLQITLRHLEGLDKMVGNGSSAMDVKSLLASAVSQCIKLYTALTYGDWILVQQTLLQFFYGRKVKVSLFLQQNMQGNDGRLILLNTGYLPYLAEKPGEIRYYENNKVIRKDYFATELKDKTKELDSVFDLCNTLGKDLYNRSYVDEITFQPSQIFHDALKAFQKNPSLHATSIPDRSGKTPRSSYLAEALANYTPSSVGNAGAKSSSKSTTSDISAKAEISLLAELLGATSPSSKDGSKGGSPEKPFKINLFPNAAFHASGGGGGGNGAKGGMDDFDDDEGGGGYDSNFIAIDIDAAAQAKTVARYTEDLGLKDFDSKADSKNHASDNDNDDLLDLMDLAK
jgi:hypothetical protein